MRCLGWLLLSGMLCGATYAQQADQSEVQVQAIVNSTISVMSYTPTVEIGSINEGSATGNLQFRIESNEPRIGLQVQVTHLYRDEDPAAVYLSVDQAAGVRLNPESASVTDGSGLTRSLTIAQTLNKPSGNFAGYKTDQVMLDSQQGNDMFIQDLSVSANWHSDSLLPSGSYTGYVVLYVAVLGK